MTIFRSYFKKNVSLVSGVDYNNSQNPVCEISYGTLNKQPSRFIFDVDLSNLIDRLNNSMINPGGITKHTLHLTNTINDSQEYIGKKSYSLNIDRATSFDLELFNVNEDWDEGGGYDFVYDNYPLSLTREPQASNWNNRKTNVPWTISGGSYQSGTTEIIGYQRFDKGCENIEIDVTDYINQRLFGTGYTGINVYSGESYGLGLKFLDTYENLETEFRQAVAFYAKNTNTWYEPYIETTINDIIIDDRNNFYLDKDNDLYLYVNVGGSVQNVTVNSVEIYDYEDDLVYTFSADSVTNVGKGIYKITLKLNSSDYPDAVIFRDVWNLTVNGIETTYDGEFYLISQNNFITFDQSNEINFNNYYFYFHGIGENEKIMAGDIKKIKLTIKEMYSNQNNSLPLDIEYRLFTTIANKYEIDVIPFTCLNRTNTGYYFNLDTSWLIPQDYSLQIRLKNGSYYQNKQTLNFTVTSDGILNKSKT
jgi:hypothetical protein